MQICGIQLTSLDVTGSKITGEGFDVLQDKFTNMEKLSLGSCMRLTNKGLLEFMSMCGCKLHDLNISDTSITSQGIDDLQGKLANIKTLNLRSCCRITDQGLLKILSRCGSMLQNLDMSETKLTGQGLDDLQGKLANIKTLKLRSCSRITDQSLLKILKMCGSNLQDLDIFFTNITGQELDELQGTFGYMKTLNLQYCSRLTDQGLFKILSMCGSKLQDLNITNTNISGQGLDELRGKLADIKTLKLRLCRFLTDQSLLKMLRMCGRKIQDLDISRTNITGQEQDEFQAKFTDMKTLNLQGCLKIEDQGLLKILSKCGSKLRDLDISSTNITGQGLDQLQGKFSDIKTLNLENCSRLTDQGRLEVLGMCRSKL